MRPLQDDWDSKFGTMCRYVSGTEWVTGSNDGTLSLWSQLKKKPAWNIRKAHAGFQESAGSANSEAGWIQAVAVCRGSDLVVSQCLAECLTFHD